MRVPFPFPNVGIVNLWLAKPPPTVFRYPLCADSVDIILDGSEDVGASDFSFCNNKAVWIHHDKATEQRAFRLSHALLRDPAKAPFRLFYEFRNQTVFWNKQTDTWTTTDGKQFRHSRRIDDHERW